jgi:hypothetical protein
MPIIVSSIGFSSRSIPVPPPDAFQQPIRILRRKDVGADGEGESPAAEPGGVKSLVDREQEYQTARKRIFDIDPSSNNEMVPEEPVSIKLRSPRGPHGNQPGFQDRRREAAKSPRRNGKDTASQIQQGEGSC